MRLWGEDFMKMKLLTAATCAVMSFAVSGAMAQDDGVARPNSYPFAAAKGVDSHAIDKAPEGAVNKGKFNDKTWKYGPSADIPPNAPRLWNPAMIKLKNGGKLYSDTVNGNSTPEQYCAAANKETNDFIWTEMQHAPGTWHDVANMWGSCPHAHAVPGVRIPNENEMDEQHATDMGALVLVVPTVRSLQEGQLAANWAFFPPLGHRSAGSNVAGTPAFWGTTSGGAYRQTINDNLVLILMIETLDGLQDADKIAKIKGVSGLFAASSDLGNFSGYRQGMPDYERAINIVHDATLKAHIHLCGPSSWWDRPDFDCFQGGPPGATRGGGRGRGRGAAAGAAPAPAPAQ
jgi:2-keto-3-deoxy-L-rhamnonate aldolase RhmA